MQGKHEIRKGTLVTKSPRKSSLGMTLAAGNPSAQQVGNMYKCSLDLDACHAQPEASSSTYQDLANFFGLTRSPTCNDNIASHPATKHACRRKGVGAQQQMLGVGCGCLNCVKVAHPRSTGCLLSQCAHTHYLSRKIHGSIYVQLIWLLIISAASPTVVIFSAPSSSRVMSNFSSRAIMIST